MEKDLPFISIFVAVRNEENCILNCLEALNLVDYPKEKVEILIGDDLSNDNSATIIKEFAQKHPQFKYFLIEKAIPKLSGKANVLAQLVPKAQGSLFFITDADVEVSPNWVIHFVEYFQNHPKLGIASGVTLPEKEFSVLNSLQTIDWMVALFTVSLLSKVGIALTAPGNNMVIRREAYYSTEGFDKLGSTITEDYAMLKALVTNGWKFRGTHKREIVAETSPNKTIHALFQQRKRWMKGAIQTNSLWGIGLYFLALLPVILVGIYLLSPLVLLSIFLVRWFIFYLYILTLILYYRKYKLIFVLPFFELYQLTFLPITALLFLKNKEVNWKGRSYD